MRALMGSVGGPGSQPGGFFLISEAMSLAFPLGMFGPIAAVFPTG